MKAEIRIYRQGDEGRMALRPDMAAQFAQMDARVHDGVKWSLVEDGRVLAIGGAAFDETDASHDLWLLAGGLRPRHWWQIYQRTRNLMLELKGAGPQARIWVEAIPCKGAREFIERLGFRKSAEEGIYYA
ncbi:hypothetical protein [Asticcacaulis taihuensis]|uniref:hypothetical protein n=1 Tax=Asticcacaulis taihuensis TaxID=260084 RepID=UPI0026F2E556|nr:hypothetical protein [Asticcacaulis taihuensis]